MQNCVLDKFGGVVTYRIDILMIYGVPESLKLRLAEIGVESWLRQFGLVAIAGHLFQQVRVED